MTRDKGYDYCESLGMGLAWWNSDRSYADMKSVQKLTYAANCNYFQTLVAGI